MHIVSVVPFFCTLSNCFFFLMYKFHWGYFQWLHHIILCCATSDFHEIASICLSPFFCIHSTQATLTCWRVSALFALSWTNHASIPVAHSATSIDITVPATSVCGGHWPLLKMVQMHPLWLLAFSWRHCLYILHYMSLCSLSYSWKNTSSQTERHGIILLAYTFPTWEGILRWCWIGPSVNICWPKE